MSKLKDLTGLKFGKLLVIKRVEGKCTPWLCLCDCGNEIVVRGTNLRSGNTTSCGCFCEHHGKRKTKLYGVWATMRNRCYNENVKVYYRYGGRGIEVCEEWKNSFTCFHNWAISNGYKEGLTLDRIDVDGNYEPSNCRWVTMKIQNNNRRDTISVEINGEKHTLREWSELSGINWGTIRRRYYRGKRGEALIK